MKRAALSAPADIWEHFLFSVKRCQPFWAISTEERHKKAPRSNRKRRAEGARLR